MFVCMCACTYVYIYMLERESAVSVRLPPYEPTDGWTGERTNGKGTRLLAFCSRRVKDRMGGGGWARWVERLRRNYLSSCVFIFRVITNEVNRNRTKLILLSVEKSHRRLSVHPRPRSFCPRLTATRRDATHRVRVCATFTQPASRECAAFSTLVKRTGRTAH